MNTEPTEISKEFMTDLMDYFGIENTVDQKVAYALLLTRTANNYKHSSDTFFVCSIMKHNGEYGYYPFDTMPKMMDFAKDYLIYGNADSEFITRRIWEELANSEHNRLEFNGRKRSPVVRKRSLIKQICAVLNMIDNEQSLFDILDYASELTTKEAKVVG